MMFGFAELGRLPKALILTVSFVFLCVSVCLLIHVCRRRNGLGEALCALLGVLYCGGMIVIYDAYEKGAFYDNWPLHPFAERAAEFPLIFPLLGLCVVIFLLFVSLAREWKREKRSITSSSVKESIDCLTTGLCFSYPNGIVVLVNHQMNALCYRILGEDLQNAVSFWERISEGEFYGTAERLSFGAHPMFRLNDGTVWTFGREEMQDVVQITAVETTRLHAITEELRNHNLELAAMNLRLKKHAENVEEMTRAKERLEIKARIHSEFGKALLSTRRYLQDEEADAEEILNEWKRNIAMLRMKTVAPRDEDPMSILMKVASAAGITVELCGDMPEEESIRQLFFEAASEALTNAVAHAGATCLHIEVMREAERVSVRFTNDGMPPPDAIAEGGGLGALRQKTVRIGGEMLVETANGFALTLSVLRKEVNRFV